jgi:hypothetical protein
VDLKVVGCKPVMSAQMGPDAIDPEEFASIIREHEAGGLDAWISLVGLPPSGRGGLGAVGTRNRDGRPVVAADVNVSYEPKVLQKYFREGLLDAVVLYPPTEGRRRILVRSVDELPAEGFER